MNPRLRFDRAAALRAPPARARGLQRAVPAAHPGAVRLAPIGGARVVIGFAGLVDGALDLPGAKERALELLRHCGFADTGSEPAVAPDEAVARMRDHLAEHPEVQR